MTRIFTKLLKRQRGQSNGGPRDRQRWIRGVRQGRTATVDADRDATNQIAHANRQATPEQRKARVIVRRRVDRLDGDGFELGGEDDGHDDAVDGHDFAEDDGDEVLCSYPRGFDAAADDGSAGDKDSPVED